MIEFFRQHLFPVSAETDDLQTWRVHLLNGLLTIVLALGIAAAVPSTLMALRDGLWPIALIDVIAVAWIYLLQHRREMDYTWRARNLLAIIYLLGLALLFVVGQASQIYLMAVPVVAVLLIGLPMALWALALNGLTLLVVGYLVNADISLGTLDLPPFMRWVVITINFLLISSAMTLSCAFLLSGFERTLRRLRTHAAELDHQAHHDALTGLANRSLMLDRLNQALAKAGRQGKRIAICILDLDHFKNVNDSLGHFVGDELIIGAAQRINKSTRAGDTVARLGGDEFVVLLDDPGDEATIATAVTRILDGVSGDYHTQHHELHVACSIGVAVYPRDGQDADTLMRNADTALYRAKEQGRSRFQFYQTEMNARLSERMSMETQLRRAIDRQEFSLHYQAQFSLREKRIVGAEALLRWQHPELGRVSPAQFIPIAEDTGLIVPIGEWVLETACAEAAHLLAQGHSGLRIAVNISARQFRQVNLVADIDALLKKHQLPDGALEVEITESMLMGNLDETIDTLAQIKQRQLSVAVDDFGTGFSSLAYLTRFPIDILKIDQSFVSSLGKGNQQDAIVKTVVDLAHNLGLTAIAEGVETTEQLARLQALNVDIVQGYLLSRPVPAEEFHALLAKPAGEIAGFVSALLRSQEQEQ